MKRKKSKKFDPKIMTEMLINPDVAEIFINDDPETQKKRIDNFTSNLVEYGAYDAYKNKRKAVIKARKKKQNNIAIDPEIMIELLERPTIKENVEKMTELELSFFKTLLVSEGIYSEYCDLRKKYGKSKLLGR